MKGAALLRLTKTIEFWQHFSQVVRVLASQVRFLDLAASAPSAPLCIGSVYHGIFVQDLVICRCNEAACANDAERRYPHGVVHASTRRYCIEVPYAGRVDT